MIKYCDLSASYMPISSFNGLLPFRDGLGWLPFECPVLCIQDIEIGGSGGGGSSAWKDSAKVYAGDSVVLIREGDFRTPSRVMISSGGESTRPPVV